MGFLKKVGGFLKKAAPIAGSIVGGIVGGPVGAKIGGALGGVISSSGRGGGGNQGGGGQQPFAVDKTAFQESERQKQLYDTINTRMGNVENRQAPTATATQVGGPLTATATQATATGAYDAERINPNDLGLSAGTGFTAGDIERAAAQGVDIGALRGMGGQAGVAGAGSASAARIDRTQSDELRALQMELIQKMRGEADGIGSDALTRALRQTTDRGVAAQAALMNTARGNTALNARNAANAMTRVSQQGAQQGLDAFAQERAMARQLGAQTMAQARGVDADLAAQQAGFENAAALTNAQLATQASIANAQNQTQASLSNADMMARAMMQNAQLGTNVSLANADAFNRNQQFNATQQQQAALERDRILSQIGLSNQDAVNAARSQANQFAQQTGLFNAGAANDLQSQLLGLNNQRDLTNAQLSQQANLANQAAQLQQMGMNDAQIQFMLGLQNNMNQFGANQGMDLQRLLSSNFNQQSQLNAQVNQQQQQRRDSILGKLGEGLTSFAMQKWGGGGK